MNKVIVLTTCEDDNCCCFPPKTTVVMISLLSTVVCVVDMYTFKLMMTPCCGVRQYVDSARHVLTVLFQLANILLIAAAVLDNAAFAAVYIWYALSYVLLGLCLSILECACRLLHGGEVCLAVFGCEVAFYFVISRCLPIVNSFKQHLDETASRNTFQ